VASRPGRHPLSRSVLGRLRRGQEGHSSCDRDREPRSRRRPRLPRVGRSRAVWAYNRHVRFGFIAVALSVAIAATVGSARATSQNPVLSSHGIGAVRLGTTKTHAVEALTPVLGRPSRQFVSGLCGPVYTEVEWGHLYAEFRRGRLSGFRYMRGAWLKQGVSPGEGSAQVGPNLTTSKRIGLGSALMQVRRAYGTLRLVGTDRWQSRDGLVFYVSFATRQPPPPGSRITQIEYGTCGDW
jgi:hypothetical protein